MPSRMITSHLGGFYGQKGRITKGCLGYFLKQDSQTWRRLAGHPITPTWFPSDWLIQDDLRLPCAPLHTREVSDKQGFSDARFRSGRLAVL